MFPNQYTLNFKKVMSCFMKGKKSLGVKGNILRIPMVNSLIWELGFFKSLKTLLMEISNIKSLRHLDIFMLLEIFEQGK